MKAPRSLEELKNSRWAKMFADPSEREIILAKADFLLERLSPKSRVAQKARVALQLLRDALQGKTSLSAYQLIVLGAAIAYFVSPADAIPDILPLVGWMDDIGVLNLAIGAILALSRPKDGNAASAGNSDATASSSDVEQASLENGSGKES